MKEDSKYIAALRRAIDTFDDQDTEMNVDDSAKSVRHYARAMDDLRKSPADIRKDGMDVVHTRFECESKLHIASWRACGHTFKGYGHHLWATLPVLFRRFGCLELFSQTPVEAMIQKIGRILPHLALKPGGRFSVETLNEGPEACAVEVEKRRANLKSLSRALYEELLMEFVDGEYEPLPAKRAEHKSTRKLRDLMLEVDMDIDNGMIMQWDEWVAYWRRYALSRRIRAPVTSLGRCARTLCVCDA